MLGLRCIRAAWTPMRTTLSTTTSRSLTISSALQPSALRLTPSYTSSSIASQPSSILSSLQKATSALAVSPAHSSRTFSSTASLGVKRDTYNPSRRVQKRRHGFLARLKTKKGKDLLNRRKTKGRKNMSW